MTEYNRIKEAVLRKEYIFFEEGNYNLNIIWERTKDHITNEFDDYCHILYLLNGEEKYLRIKGTTKPGILTGTKSEGHQRHILCPSQYKSSWVYEKSARRNYPFLSQVKLLKCFKVNEDNTIDNSIIINDTAMCTQTHLMSQIDKSGFKVNNWSVECMGAEYPEYKQLIDLIELSIPIWGNKFTQTILRSPDIKY